MLYLEIGIGLGFDEADEWWHCDTFSTCCSRWRGVTAIICLKIRISFGFSEADEWWPM